MPEVDPQSPGNWTLAKAYVTPTYPHMAGDMYVSHLIGARVREGRGARNPLKSANNDSKLEFIIIALLDFPLRKKQEKTNNDKNATKQICENPTICKNMENE